MGPGDRLTAHDVELLGCVSGAPGDAGLLVASTLAPDAHLPVRTSEQGTFVRMEAPRSLLDRDAWLVVADRPPVQVSIVAHAEGIAACRPGGAVEVARAPAVSVTAQGVRGPLRRFDVAGCLSVGVSRSGVAVWEPYEVEGCTVAAVDRRGRESLAVARAAVARGPLYVGPATLAFLHLPVERRWGRLWTLPDEAHVFPAGWWVDAVDGRALRGRGAVDELVRALEPVGEHEVLLRSGSREERVRVRHGGGW